MSAARIAALVLLFFALGAPGLAHAEDVDLRRKLSVSGMSSTLVANDAARVSLTVQAKRPTAQTALRAASAKLQRVIGRVRATGVEEADIRTREISVDKLVKRLKGGATRTRGYLATQGVTVVVRNVSTVGLLVDGAVAAGATRVAGPEFFVFDTTRVYAEALGLAFDDAKAKAELLAERSGAKLGPVLSIAERGEVAEQSSADASPAVAAPAPPRVPPPTQPGQSRFDALVSVVFELVAA